MKRKICSIILALSFCFGILGGCGESTTSGSGGGIAPDYTNAKGKFGFSTYSVPLPTDEQFQLYKEAGLRTMLMSGEYLGFYQGDIATRDGVDLNTLEKFFSLADKYGIEILDFSMAMENIINSKDRQAIYEKYPNVLKGFFINDEPGVIGLDEMAKHTGWVNEKYPGATYTTTLHPSWADVKKELDEGKGKVNNINEYYQYMVDNILLEMDGPKILCADDYPCKRYGFDGRNFLNTLIAMSEVAYPYPKIIKQMCLNCSTFREVNEAPGPNARPENEWVGAYEKEVTEMEIRMPAITSLAFGFTSFLYFMYGPFPHSDDITIQRSGLSLTNDKSPISYVNGKTVEKTEYYDYVKNTNLELESFEKCLTSFKWYGAKMIAQSGLYDLQAKALNTKFGDNISSFSRLSSVRASGDADVIIGYFKEGKTREGYFVSNYGGYSEIVNGLPKDKKGIYLNAASYEYKRNATVKLEFKNYDKVYIVKNGVTTTDMNLAKHILTQELKPGDYMFVIPY